MRSVLSPRGSVTPTFSISMFQVIVVADVGLISLAFFVRIVKRAIAFFIFFSLHPCRIYFTVCSSVMQLPPAHFFFAASSNSACLLLLLLLFNTMSNGVNRTMNSIKEKKLKRNSKRAKFGSTCLRT
jgi:hypothetical protein